jgi:hypothetical protein
MIAFARRRRPLRRNHRKPSRRVVRLTSRRASIRRRGALRRVATTVARATSSPPPATPLLSKHLVHDHNGSHMDALGDCSPESMGELGDPPLCSRMSPVIRSRRAGAERWRGRALLLVAAGAIHIASWRSTTGPSGRSQPIRTLRAARVARAQSMPRPPCGSCRRRARPRSFRRRVDLAWRLYTLGLLAEELAE